MVLKTRARDIWAKSNTFENQRIIRISNARKLQPVMNECDKTNRPNHVTDATEFCE